MRLIDRSAPVSVLKPPVTYNPLTRIVHMNIVLGTNLLYITRNIYCNIDVILSSHYELDCNFYNVFYKIIVTSGTMWRRELLLRTLT